MGLLEKMPEQIAFAQIQLLVSYRGKLRSFACCLLEGSCMLSGLHEEPPIKTSPQTTSLEATKST